MIGSNGSVIPLFKNQIERGTVTVTDKEVTRYFMTISQAVELVLNSLAISNGGELFVLDMGESVKILDIAEKLIRDIGKEPYKDIKIEFTGLRQGDKLHEKLFYDFELPQKTQCDKILRVNGSAIAGLTSEIKKLYRMAAENDRGGITELMMKITDKDLIGRI